MTSQQKVIYDKTTYIQWIHFIDSIHLININSLNWFEIATLALKVPKGFESYQRHPSYLSVPKLYFFGHTANHIITRSSESDGRSDVTDSLECPDKFRVP